MIRRDKALGIYKIGMILCYDLENNMYYPHTLTRKFQNSKDYQAKETLYSLRNMQEINTLASETPVIDTRADILKEVCD